MHIKEVFSLSNMFVYGIDANVLTREQYTGTERYTFELLSEMKKMPLALGERVVLYSSKELPILDPLPVGWEVKVLTLPLKKGWTHIRLSAELLLNPPNIYFSPAHEIPLFHRKTKIISTIHDIAFAKPELNIYSLGGKGRQEWAVKRAIKNANHLLTISETTKNDLKAIYNLKDDFVTVAHLGINVGYFVESNIKKPYILSVGRIEKKKNIENLVKAFHLFIEKSPESELQLLLAGGRGFEFEKIKESIDSGIAKDRIKLLGFITDEKKKILLSEALIYAFPSYYEGFGIPILEAMASGVPVIASSISALKEVGGDAALYCGAQDLDAWVNAIKMIESSGELQEKLVMLGKKRVLEFSWKKTAEKTWEVLRSP